MSTAQLEALTVPQLQALEAVQVAALRPEVVAALDKKALGQLPTAVVAKLSPPAVAELFRARLELVSSAMLGALGEAQVKALPPAVVARLSEKQIGALPCVAVPWLSSEAVRALTPLQLSWMSRPQRLALTEAQVIEIRHSAADLRSVWLPVDEFARVPAGLDSGLGQLQRNQFVHPLGVRLLGSGYAELEDRGDAVESSQAFGLGIQFELPSSKSEEWLWGGQLVISRGSEPGRLATAREAGESLLTPRSQATSLLAGADLYSPLKNSKVWMGVGSRLEIARMTWVVAPPTGDAVPVDVTTGVFGLAFLTRWLFESATNEVEVRLYAGPTLRGYSADAGDRRALNAADVHDLGKAMLGETGNFWWGAEARALLRINAIEVGAIIPWSEGKAAGLSGVHLMPFISLQPGAMLVEL